MDNSTGLNPTLNLDSGTTYYQIKFTCNTFQMDGGTYKFGIDYVTDTSSYINCTTSTVNGGNLVLTQHGTSNPTFWFSILTCANAPSGDWSGPSGYLDRISGNNLQLASLH